jgi:putative hydrolase of the HAD superfamily
VSGGAPILVLDLGGVVYRAWPDDAFHQRWCGRCGCGADLLAERLWAGDEWRAAMLGEIEEPTCYAAAAERLGVDLALVGEMVADAFYMRPDEALAAYVARLRGRGVRTAALTNNTAGAAALRARPEIARLFDVVISSADLGFIKPDVAIFRLAEAALGASPEGLVLVDDVAANIEAARSLGWRGVWFQSTDQALAELGGIFGAQRAPPPATARNQAF